MAKWQLPVVGAAGELIPFMSQKEREHFAFTVVDMAGGHERAVDELIRDTEWFKKCYFELYFTRHTKPNTNVDVRHQHSFEEMLAKLDAAEKNGGILDVEFEEVSDAPVNQRE